MTVIRASELSEFGYCQKKWFLNRTTPKDSAFTSSHLLKGQQVHDELDRQFMAKVTTSIRFQTFMEATRRVVMRPDASDAVFRTQVGEVLLIGKPDELWSDSTGIYVVEDKPHFSAWEGYRLQVMAYAFIIFRENQRKLGLLGKKVFGLLRNRDTGEIFWRRPYTKEIDRVIEGKLLAMHKCLTVRDLTEKVTNKRKCAGCRFEQKCWGNVQR
ncbi:Dna2/Cas4 domain-containing protein [Candidatus Micrarchaeota archaeon]|nr:Dna2/Cas4 domain-containing protein [Candidatus Micrarchaeota archaeon]